MAFKRLEDNLNIHQSLPDKPTLDAQEIKVKFDEAANIIKDFINDFLTDLEAKGVFANGDTFTYLKKIIANGGIEGNVKGDLEGNAKTATVSSSCSGNAATATTASNCSR